MRYLGGKYRIAKYLAAVVNGARKRGQWVWDPFCGGLSMSVALSVAGPVWATDVNASLIAMYRAARSGWDPPSEITPEDYARAKRLPDSDPLKAFCGFGCSYGGKWFGGLARVHASRPNTPPSKSTRAFLRDKLPLVASVARLDFMSVAPQPFEDPPVIYCDPPYAGTIGYAGTDAFSRKEFVRRVRAWSAHTDIFVSEYEFPIGRVVWERKAPPQVCFRPDAVERLYHVARGSL